MTATFLRIELLRILREPRAMILTIALPVVLFVVFNALFSGQLGEISTTAYTMQSMAAYGSMGAALLSAGAIVLERRIGWNRQLRLTPLRPWGYLLTKAAASWLYTVPALVLVYAAGALAGVRMSPGRWVELLAVTWVALVPFVLLGITLGLLGSSQSIRPVVMTLMLGLALLGGLWIPIEVMPPTLSSVAHVLPSFWLGMAGRAVLGGPAPGATGVAVLAAWAAAIAAVGVFRYRADTGRS